MQDRRQSDPSQHPLVNGNRLHQIDALRALAAMLVVVTHASSGFWSYATKAGHSDLLYRFVQSVDAGRIGVIVFFIVSGFVVANTLHAPGANLFKFAIRRILRLYPLFWLSIILVLLFLGGRNELIPLNMDWKTIAANFTMIPTLLGFDPLMIIYWTLETELVFYLVAAVVYKLGYLFAPKKLLVLICVLIGVFAAVMFGVVPSPRTLAWKSLGLNLAFMFWGSLFYTAFAASTTEKPIIKCCHPIVLAAAAVLAPSIFTMLRFLSSGNVDDLRWAIAYPSALLIFSVLYFANGNWTRKASHLGLISYSMYLLHPAAIIAVSLFIDAHGFLFAGAGLPLLSLITVGVTIAMSFIAYVFIEKPFISLGRKLTSESASPVNFSRSTPLSH
jgi:peptidoglycan/LPS O-acetylase OafA/YrhL